MQHQKDNFKELIQPTSIYCYPNTNVYFNNKNIIDLNQLNYLEKMLVTLQLSKLQLKNKYNLNEEDLYLKATSNIFDINKLMSLHKFLFGELYPFAGEIRKENIIKDSTPFCPFEYITINLNQLLTKMNKEINYVHNQEDLLDFIVKYYGEFNIIHPFRDGNGRCIREYLREFVEYYSKKLNIGDYTLDYSIISNDDHYKELFNLGSMRSVLYDYEILKYIFEKLLVNKEEIREIKR
jgi:cell filamentation protein